LNVIPPIRDDQQSVLFVGASVVMLPKKQRDARIVSSVFPELGWDKMLDGVRAKDRLFRMTSPDTSFGSSSKRWAE
jgi:hypothetical protein